MGMFDYVDVGGPVNCPECDEQLRDFQTKDGPRMLSRIHWTRVNNFYTTCVRCRTWVEFTRKPPHEDTPRFDGYELHTEKIPKHKP